jgi:hypothetical protein
MGNDRMFCAEAQGNKAIEYKKKEGEMEKLNGADVSEWDEMVIEASKDRSKGRRGILYFKIKITPEIARKLIENQMPNRTRSKLTSWKYSIDMLQGRWEENGETIKINEDFRLIDGQNRLTALIKADVAQELTIAYGVNYEKAFPTIDRNMKRTPGHTLSIHNVPNANNISALIKTVYFYENNMLDGKQNNPKLAPSSQTILDYYDMYGPDLQDSYKFVSRAIYDKYRRLFPPLTMLSACHFIFSKIDSDAADDFFEDLQPNKSLGVTDPVLLLRNRCLQNAASKAKLHKYEIMALFIKAWNCRRRNLPLKVLKYVTDPSMREKFPVAI